MRRSTFIVLPFLLAFVALAASAQGGEDYLATRHDDLHLKPDGRPIKGSEFRLLCWTLPESAAPDEEIRSTITWETDRGNPNAVVYATVIGEWCPNDPISRLHQGMQGRPGNRVEKTFSIKAPEQPGTYRVRWILVQAFAPLTEFYGKARGDVNDPPAGTWAEVSFTVSESMQHGSSASIVDERTGHAYELVSAPLLWEDARQAAAEKSFRGVRGHLVTINSADENAFVYSQFCKRPGGIWLGAHRAGAEWRWITAEAWHSYVNWAPREPNNHQGSGENWLCMYGPDGAAPGRWNDISGYTLAYVIEYDVEDARATAAPSTPIFENERAIVFLVKPEESKTKELAEQLAAKALAAAAKKVVTTALSEVLPATASKLGGHVISIITSAPSVGNPTKLDVQIVAENKATDVVDKGQEFLPLILFNYSDSFNHGVSLTLSGERASSDWQIISQDQLLTVEEMVKLNELGSPGMLFLVVPKRPVKLDSAGKYQIEVVARSIEARNTFVVSVSDGRTNEQPRNPKSGQSMIRLIDRVTVPKVAFFDSDTAYSGRRISLSGNGTILAFGTEDGKAITWDIGQRKELGRYDCGSAAVRAVALSEDGRYLAAGAGNGDVKIWDLNDNRLLWTAKHGKSDDDKVLSIAFGSSEVLVTGLWPNYVSQIDPMTGRARATLKGHKTWVYKIQLAKGGLAASVADDEAIVWNVKESRIVHRISHKDACSVAISDSGSVLATSTMRGEVRIWELPSCKQLQSWTAGEGHDITDLTLAPTGDRVLIAERMKWGKGAEGRVLMRNTTTGSVLWETSLSGSEGANLAWSTDGHTLAIRISSGTIEVYEVQE